MKTAFIILFASFCTTGAYSQEQVFLMDSIMSIYMENGYANKHFMPEGKEDENDLRQGFWKDYEVILDYNVSISEGVPKQQFGYYLFYAEGKFVDGKRQGPWKFYVIEDKTFKHFLNKEVSFVNGEMEGVCKHYFPSGKLASTDFRVAGQVEGEAKWYYENGKIKGTTQHKHNLRDGKSVYYYPSGKLHYEIDYVNDSLDGKWTAYYENGKVQETESYVKDAIHGTYKYFYENGQLWIEKEHLYGRLMNVKGSFDQSGNPRDFGTIKNGNGTVKYYTEEGRVYSVHTVENGIVVKEEDL